MTNDAGVVARAATKGLQYARGASLMKPWWINIYPFLCQHSFFLRR